MACACSRTCAAPSSNHPASSGHAPQPPPGMTTVPGMSALPLNITMNRNRARPFYTGFRTPPRLDDFSAAGLHDGGRADRPFGPKQCDVRVFTGPGTGGHDVGSPGSDLDGLTECLINRPGCPVVAGLAGAAACCRVEVGGHGPHDLDV